MPGTNEIYDEHDLEDRRAELRPIPEKDWSDSSSPPVQRMIDLLPGEMLEDAPGDGRLACGVLAAPALEDGVDPSVYSEPHKNSLYSKAWVEKLVRALATAEGCEAITGCTPHPLTLKSSRGRFDTTPDPVPLRLRRPSGA